MKDMKSNAQYNTPLSDEALTQVAGGQSDKTEANQAAEAKGFFKFKKKKFFHHHY